MNTMNKKTNADSNKTVLIPLDGSATTMTTTTTTSTDLSSPPAAAISSSMSLQQRIISAALWSFFAGDAMSAPTHWFYGGHSQIQQYYGRPSGITKYTKPSYTLPGSILNKSNLNGGGRTTTKPPTTSRFNNNNNNNNNKKNIIGDIINHGKQELWDPQQQIHYHATLEAGENTLECSIARVLLRCITNHHGRFDMDQFRTAYIEFMMTPNSHNDTYASTCHRMFFANLYFHQLDPKHCPDNDHHNVDTIDGLVLPTITAIAVAGQSSGTVEQAAEQAAMTVAVIRNSPIVLQRYARAWGAFVFQAIRGATAAAEMTTTTTTTTTTESFPKQLVPFLIQEMARSLQLRTPQIRQNSHDEITACYLDSAVPAMLDTLLKYMPNNNTNDNNTYPKPGMTVWDAIIQNANIGGENVHRGSCLGAIWGAVEASTTLAAATTTTTTTNTAASNQINHNNDNGLRHSQLLMNGLYHHDELAKEIDAFIIAISSSSSNNNNNNNKETATTATSTTNEI